MKTLVTVCLLGLSSLGTLTSSAAPSHQMADFPASKQMLIPAEGIEEDPGQSFMLPKVAREKITIKVFDIQGNLIAQKQVTIEEMLQHPELTPYVPQGSIFVCFSHQTAYYFLDKPII